MGLFDIFGGQQAPQQRPQMNPQQMQQQMKRDVDAVKAHPGSFLKNRGYNIPDGMTDAEQITRYLLQTGQIGGGRLQAVMRMFGGR